MSMAHPVEKDGSGSFAAIGSLEKFFCGDGVEN